MTDGKNNNGNHRSFRLIFIANPIMLAIQSDTAQNGIRLAKYIPDVLESQHGKTVQ